MVEIIWEYLIHEEKRASFLRYYARDGVWAKFFGQSGSYRGTVLLREVSRPNRYLTIDTWDSLASYGTFRRDHADEYAEIDRICEDYTVEERHLGTFETL